MITTPSRQPAAAILRNYVPLGSRILDAACGSGLTGSALKNLGYEHIEGIDVAAELLVFAWQTGSYDRVQRVDMQVFPLPFEDGEFDAVDFIGALTYFETDQILRELCRIVRRGGRVVFSQRDDIMRDERYGERLEAMEGDGLWERSFGTEPMPYLPDHPEYGEEIKVQYFVHEVM